MKPYKKARKTTNKWNGLKREIFKRTKADFVSINCPENHETSPTYKPKTKDETRLDGKIQNMRLKKILNKI